MCTYKAKQSSVLCRHHVTICSPTSLWEGQTEKHKEVRIHGPVIKSFWRILGHLTLQLKNKRSKLKHPDPLLNKQLSEKRATNFLVLKMRGHGRFHKGLFLHCKMRNGMRNPGRKSEKHQIRTLAFFSDIFILNFKSELLFLSYIFLSISPKFSFTLCS